MNQLLQSPLTTIVMIAMIALSYAFIFLFAWQNLKLRRKYVRLINQTNVPDLEHIILHLQAEMERLDLRQTELEQYLTDLHQKTKHLKAKLYIHRYSAFSNEHTGLSYSIALLDDFHNGIVLTGLYNRDQSYTYAKPITNGGSEFQLSPEEKEAVERAKNVISL